MELLVKPSVLTTQLSQVIRLTIPQEDGQGTVEAVLLAHNIMELMQESRSKQRVAAIERSIDILLAKTGSNDNDTARA